MGTYIHYLIESLYFEAYCYNAEVNHKYTLIYIDIWEKKGVLNALSPLISSYVCISSFLVPLYFHLNSISCFSVFLWIYCPNLSSMETSCNLLPSFICYLVCLHFNLGTFVPIKSVSLGAWPSEISQNQSCRIGSSFLHSEIHLCLAWMKPSDSVAVRHHRYC